MAQKTRNQVTTQIGNKIYDNNNKEILAEMVREVLYDFRDSYFNLLDDTLANLNYSQGVTLAQQLANSNNVPPLWGTTGYFNITSTNEAVSDFSGESGIVTSAFKHSMGGPDIKIKITLSQGVSNKKILVQVHTSNYTDTEMNNSNDICHPVVYVSGGQEIWVALREVSGNSQNIRLEIFAFSVNTGS